MPLLIRTVTGNGQEDGEVTVKGAFPPQMHVLLMVVIQGLSLHGSFGIFRKDQFLPIWGSWDS